MHLFHHVLIHATHITKIYVGILNSTALTLFAYNSLQSLKECCSSTLVGEVQPQLLSPNSGSGDLWGGEGGNVPTEQVNITYHHSILLLGLKVPEVSL